MNTRAYIARTGTSWIFIALLASSLGCARTKANTREAAADAGTEASAAGDGGSPAALTASVDGGDQNISGSFSLAGATGMAISWEYVPEAQICFAPSSAKVPKDAQAKLDLAIARFKASTSAQTELGVSPMTSTKDKASTAAKIRKQRSAALVAMLVKKGIDKSKIIDKSAEPEWGLGGGGFGAGFGMPGDAQPCVELAVVTKTPVTMGGEAPDAAPSPL